MKTVVWVEDAGNFEGVFAGNKEDRNLLAMVYPFDELNESDNAGIQIWMGSFTIPLADLQKYRTQVRDAIANRKAQERYENAMIAKYPVGATVAYFEREQYGKVIKVEAGNGNVYIHARLDNGNYVKGTLSEFGKI